jgi:DNA-binding beta-propeller fold protein YncE
MFRCSAPRPLIPARPARFRAAMALAAVAVAVAGCASAPTVTEFKPVWPAPPLKTRIEYVRSLASDQDFKREPTFSESLAELLSGRKPPANHIGEPMGLAVSDDGNRLYVADYAQPEVLVFDFVAKQMRRIGGEAPLQRPFGLALDADENLYVVEQERKGITVFSRDGRPLRFITDPSFERPEGIAIDRQRGRMYVVDTGHTKSVRHDVKIMDLDGKPLGTLGKGKGTKPGEFLFPTYVTLDRDGNVYVTDTLNSRVQVFDPQGEYVKSYGSRGNAWGMFDKPKGAALDSFGNLYVVDSGWSNVQIFNPKGEVLLFFGGSGRNPGLMWAPTAIAIDARNRIYVADHTNRRIGVYQLVNTTAADSLAPTDTSATSGPGAETPKQN